MYLHFPRRHLEKSKGTKLAAVGMFIAFGAAMLDSIVSIYIDSFVHSNALVGVIAGTIALFATFFFFITPPIIKKYPETSLWIKATIVGILGYVIYYFVNNIWVFTIVAILMAFFQVIRAQTKGILVRDLYNKKKIASGEAIQYTLANLGFMIGPLLGGFIAANLGVRPVFLFVALMFTFALIAFKNIGIKNINRQTKDTKIFTNLKEFVKKPGLLRAYLLRGGLTVYWGILYVFMPLFILESGLKEYWIGIFLFSIATPLVILEYSIGKKADNIKLKKFFMLGYAVLALASLIAFFVVDIYLWMIIFTVASLGAAMLEPNSETQFFRLVKRNEEEKFYGPFQTSVFLMGSISKFLAGAVLAIFANQFVFLLLFFLMTGLFVVSTKVKV